MFQFILQYISLQGLIWLIVLLPLVSSAINWLLAALSSRFGWRGVFPVVSVVGTAGPLLSFLAAVVVFWVLTALEGNESAAITGPLYQWAQFAGFSIDIGLAVDQLSLVMVLVVSGVGSLIHIYSVGYMSGDDGYPRYFAELNLFLFFMLLLVLADNLILMFVGWEGVGLCSYLLIGFWFSDIAKARAGMKAFIVNRIGDFGFIIGIFFIWHLLNDQEVIGPKIFNFEVLGRNAALLIPVATPVCLALFFGACGKSAQIPLYIWLPDAMAGPTPVSALIHAATMVTAGVYMVARLNFLYIMSPVTLQVIAYVGAATAFFAAAMGLVQRDIKKVLAYSTISQLGLMFLAEGVGAFGNGIFHLVTHAFFKAALFLCAGYIIHTLKGEHDLFKMGGLKKYMPGTFAVFFAAALAISGIWPFAGFFSKDEILWEVYNRGHLGLWLVGFVTSGITAFYIFRAVSLVFFGSSNVPQPQRDSIRESSISILVPLVLLGILSVTGGWLNDSLMEFLRPVFASAVFEEEASHKNLEHIMAIISVLWAIHWAFVAWIIYVQRPTWPVATAKRFKRIYSLLINKFYIDEVYQFLFVRPVYFISDKILSNVVDNSLIDCICVNGAGRVTGLLGRVIPVIQTGFVPHYLFFTVIAIAALIGWLVF